jgi:hypothetical protein
VLRKSAINLVVRPRPAFVTEGEKSLISFVLNNAVHAPGSAACGLRHRLLTNSKNKETEAMKNINKRVILAVILGLLLVGAVAAAHAAVLVPCVHWVRLHPAGDIVGYGRYGPIIVPCRHLVQLHPGGDIIY